MLIYVPKMVIPMIWVHNTTLESNDKTKILDILQDLIPKTKGVSKPEPMTDNGRCSTFLPFFSSNQSPDVSFLLRTVHRHYFTLFTAHMLSTPPQLSVQPSGMRFQHVSSFMMAGLVLTWGANRVDLFIHSCGFIFWCCLEACSRCKSN